MVLIILKFNLLFKYILQDPCEPSQTPPPVEIRPATVSSMGDLDESLVPHPKVLQHKETASFAESDYSNDDDDEMISNTNNHNQSAVLIDLSHSDDELIAKNVTFEKPFPKNITLLDDTDDDVELMQDVENVNRNVQNFKTLPEKEINKF